jgi:hypothetical protein
LAAPSFFAGGLAAGQHFNFTGDFRQRHLLRGIPDKFDDGLSVARIAIIHRRKKMQSDTGGIRSKASCNYKQSLAFPTIIWEDETVRANVL